MPESEHSCDSSYLYQRICKYQANTRKIFLSDVSQLTQMRDDEKSQTYNSIVRIPMDLIDAKMSLWSKRR